MVYSNTAVQSVGGNEYGKSGHLCVFTFLKHLMMPLIGLEVQFFRFSFLYTCMPQTLIACRAMELRFLKWKHCSTMPLG